jgi:hypothetical protein
MVQIQEQIHEGAPAIVASDRRKHVVPNNHVSPVPREARRVGIRRTRDLQHNLVILAKENHQVLGALTASL